MEFDTGASLSVLNKKVLNDLLCGSNKLQLEKTNVTFKTYSGQSRNTEVIFNVTALLKKEPIIFHAYPHDEHLCPVSLIKQYCLIRDALVPSTEEAFFLTHGKTHHAATKDPWHDGLKIPCF